MLMYLATGLRIQEIISLRGKDVHVDEDIDSCLPAKGTNYRSREVREPQVKDALLDYLSSAGRMNNLNTDAPSWTRQDRVRMLGEALTAHCFVKNLKKYA